MTKIERGCVNLYYLENYLIEKFLDPLTIEESKSKMKILKLGSEEFKDEILNYIRSKPDFWITNSEVYLKLLEGITNYINHNDYENKNIKAIYNYAYSNDFTLIKQINKDNNINTNCILNNYFEDPEFYKFLDLIERDTYIETSDSNKTILDPTILPMIYNYLICKNSLNEEQYTNLQNVILFFSFCDYNKDYDYIWNNKQENKFNNFKFKKYSLRNNKNDESIEYNYFEYLNKLGNIQEQIISLKSTSTLVSFLDYLDMKKVK
jgi:hypothetical protein